jgi:hypothetical protein
MRIVGLIFFLLVGFCHVDAQVHYIDSVKFINPTVQIPDHPRILLLAGEENQIKQSIKSQRLLHEVHLHILHQSDSLLPLPPVERILYGVRLLAKSRDCLFRVFSLSYAWRMTRDKKYFDRAEKELLAVANFSDWNPSHYLDVGEMTMAVAIGYDWLYNDLSENSRKQIHDAIVRKGIATSFDSAYPNYRKWLSVTNNWNQVCNAGISYGALATYETDTALAQKVLNRSIASIEIPMKDFGPDGAFAEGYTYWGYGTTFNIMFLSAIEKVFKTDFGLSKNEGFLKTASYLENIVGPTGKNFNYSDASEKSTLQPAMFWFANKLKDPSLLWNERFYLSPKEIKQVSERLLPALMIWGNGIDITRIVPPKTKTWSGQGKNPVAFMRSSWTDPNAIFAALKGGSPLVTHGHMDAGSFVMESDGVRWAMDFGFQDYTPLELKNIDLWANKQHGQRWEIFRYNNFSHNTLTMNNALQNVEGNAAIKSTSSTPDFMSAVTDISELYKYQVKKAERGVAIRDGKYVVIRDEVSASSKEANVRWTMLTAADVQILNDSTALLTSHSKKLTLQIPSGFQLKTWSTTPPQEYDDPNPGTTLIGFEAKIPASSIRSWNVMLIPGGVKINTKSFIKPLHEWAKD